MLGRIMLVIGGLVVVALFTALLAPFFVDWSDFRRDFENQASRILGKKVTVHGTVDARILPFPSVTMTDVRVGQDVDGTPLVQVAQFSMDMELAPFLSGEVRIFDMRIDRPKARIRLLKDGRLDWMRGSRPDFVARNVVLEGVHVTGAEIAFIDEATGRNRNLTGMTADMSASSLAGPWRVEGNATLDGRESKFSLSSGAPEAGVVPLRMKIWPDIQPVEVQLDGALSVAEARPQYKGDFGLSFLDQPINPVLPQGAKPPPPPRTRGKFELTNDRLRVPEYRIEIGAVDNPYVITGEATLDTGDKPEFLLTADGQQVDVNRLTADLMRGKTARNPHVSAQHRLNALIEMAARIPIPQVPGKASIRLPAIVADGTTVRDVRLDVRPAGDGWTVENAVATLPGRTQVEANGQLSLAGNASFIGRMLLASNQPSGFSDWLTGQVDPAIRQLKAAGFSANVNLTPQVQQFQDLELAVGVATLKGSLERRSAGEETPSLTVDLAGDDVDLDALRALASLLTGEDAGEDVLDHRLAAHVKAQRLTAFGITAQDVETNVDLGDGKLAVQRLTIGDLAGARISGQGSAEGSLLAYTGSGTLAFDAADPTAFVAMLRDRLTPHPILSRLARSGPSFADTSLKATVTLGDGLDAKINGQTNGSQITADIRSPNILDLTAETIIDGSLSLANPDAAVIAAQAGFDPLPFDGDSDASLALDLHRQGEGPARGKLVYATNRTRLEAAGDFAVAADRFGEGQYSFTVNSTDLEPTMLMAGIGLPQFGMGLPAEIKGLLKVEPQTLEASEFSGQIAGNAVSGALSLDRTASLPTVRGRLALGAVDLSWLGEGIYGPLTEADGDALSSKPFALPIFAGIDFAVDLTAENLRGLDRPPVTDVTGRLLSRAGTVSLEDAKGQWSGGQIAGRLSMSNSEGIGVLQTRFSIDNADLAPLTWQQDGEPVASGRISLELAAEATAKTPAELLSAASGSGVLHFNDLTLGRINPDLLPALVAAADRIEGEVTEPKVTPLLRDLVHAGRTAVGSVDMPFTMSGGQLRAQNVATEAGATKLTGELRIDLVRQALDGVLEIGYDAGEEAIAGGDPSVRLAYRGPIEAPEETVLAGSMTNFLSLRAFERERRRVETLQASVLEKQRLRREVTLYTFQDNERRVAREKAEAEARAKAEEEARQRAETERQAREQSEREAQTPQLTVPPTGDLFRGDGSLPGVNGN
ncbi:AsmA family protein [Rhizobium sp. 0TCS1.26]|uniref:AsmA family protein n=1 Tax=Rhizobium sp. 0TCS1.26 TaxID=3142623 RepID=UPI003D2D69F9